MIRKATCFGLVAITSLLTWAAPAWAVSDPSKIGDSVFNLFAPNVKGLWKFAVLAALLYIVFSRPKGSFIAAAFVSIFVSGAIIWNTDGFAHMVNAVGNKIL